MFLSKLKEKPEEYKAKFALAVSGLITGIIFIFWLYYNISGFGGFVENVSSISSSVKQNVGGGVVEFFKTTDSAVGNIKNIFSQMQEFQGDQKINEVEKKQYE